MVWAKTVQEVLHAVAAWLLRLHLPTVRTNTSMRKESRKTRKVKKKKRRREEGRGKVSLFICSVLF